MIASGPAGPLTPLRGPGEVPQAPAMKAPPGTVSGAAGEARAPTRAETALATDPARQAGAATASPREETGAEARFSKALVEPARPAAWMLAGDAPTEATPAGPPPTFDVSILEKERAVASAPPPVVPPAAGPAEVAPAPEAATTEEEQRPRAEPGARPSGPGADGAAPAGRAAREETAAPDARRPGGEAASPVPCATA